MATAAHRNGGGLNCASCHRPPEFDIDPKSLNNGFDRPLNGNSLREREFTVTHSPTLRDLVHPNGELNGPMFHAGTTNDLLGGILANYNFKEIHPDNDNLDPRMAPEQYPQYLDMTNQEQKQLIAFLNTLTGKDVYSNEKWSDPFDEMGNITIIGGGTTPISEVDQNKEYVQIFPNPFINHFSINSQLESYRIEILNTLGQHMRFVNMNSNLLSIDMSTLASGIYYVKVINGESELLEIHKIVKK